MSKQYPEDSLGAAKDLTQKKESDRPDFVDNIMMSPKFLSLTEEQEEGEAPTGRWEAGPF